MTFLASVIKVDNDQRPRIEAGFLDIVLECPAVGRGSMAVSCTPGPSEDIGFHLLAPGTVQRDCANIIASGTSTSCFACVVKGAKGDRSIEVRRLQVEGGTVLAWDGLSGRLCKLGPMTSIVIYDFV
jgi:hypothetical protein